MLITWGKNDKIFPPAGAEPYKRDLKMLEFHLLDAGHFALETNGEEIAELMRASWTGMCQRVRPKDRDRGGLKWSKVNRIRSDRLSFDLIVVLDSHIQITAEGESVAATADEFMRRPPRSHRDRSSPVSRSRHPSSSYL